jgi:ATP-binding cassette subfamily B (MDR/TAP) protein 6
LSSILVLKNGQIIEQGSHRELLALEGVFAAMWADQISASGDPTGSIGDQSDKKETVTGHPVDQTGPAVGHSSQREHEESGHFGDASETMPATLESTMDAGDTPPALLKDSVVSRPDESVPPASVAFPTSNETQLPSSGGHPSQSGGGVTFEDGLNAPPSRSATPDLDAEPRTKRISSQNFQRLARKISLTTRRQGSSSFIAGITRDASSASQAPRDGASTRNSNDSATASVQSDTGKRKKDKKEKRKSIF